MELSINKFSIILKGANSKDFDKSDDSFCIHILLEINGERDSFEKRYKYGDKVEIITSDLMKNLKSIVKINKGFIDPFKHDVIIIKDYDSVEEKMLAFVKRVNDKIKDFKIYKSMSYFEMTNAINNLSAKF